MFTFHIRSLCNVQCLFYLKTMTAGNSQSRKQLIQICRTIRRTHFYRSVSGWYQNDFRFPMDLPKYTYRSWQPSPTAHALIQNGCDIPPANIGRCFLMRNQTEVRSRIGISEGCNKGSKFHHSGDCLTSCFRQYTVFQHLILSVLYNTHGTCRPDPAFPAVILGANVTLYPYLYPKLRITHWQS